MVPEGAQEEPKGGPKAPKGAPGNTKRAPGDPQRDPGGPQGLGALLGSNIFFEILDFNMFLIFF